MVRPARSRPASAAARGRAFAPAAAGSRGLTIARVLTCVVAVTAAMCTALPSARADAQPTPVTFADHVDTSTDAASTSGENPWGVAVGDVNGDGKADLVLPNLHHDEISVMLGAGDGTFTREDVSIPSGPNTGAVALADFNGDGKPDIAATNGGGHSVSVYLGGGDGTFGAPVPYQTGDEDPLNQSIAAGDLNGDGKPDLVVADSASNTVSVLPGNGDGTFGAAQRFTTGAGPQAVALFQDPVTKNVDIAAATADSGAVAVLRGVDLDHGTVSRVDAYGAGAGAGSVAVGDLNGDGIPDLVVGNHDAGTISVLLGASDGTFGAATNYDSGVAGHSAPESVTVADFNHDGHPDVAVSNGATADGTGAGVSVLLGDGTGALGTAQNFAVGNGPLGIAAADLDGDGLPDLITANSSDDTISMLRNTTGTSSSTGGGGAPTTPDHRAVVGVSSDGNFVGDVGIADLDTDDFERVANDDIGGIGPVLSPDGTKVALWVPDGSGEGCDTRVTLVVADLSGDNQQPVTQESLPLLCPTFLENSPDQAQLGLAWAPDGNSLYYDDPDDSSIHQVGVDGTGDHKIVSVPKDGDGNTGDALAYPVVDPKDGSLWVALPDAGQYTTTGILSRPDHQPGIYQVVDGHLADEPIVAEDAIWPAFSPDGAVLAWITNGLHGDSYDWYGSLRSRDMTSGTVTTVVAPRHDSQGSEWLGVLPNLIQVDHETGPDAGTYFGYLGLNESEGIESAYLRTALGAGQPAVAAARQWNDVPGDSVASFAGEPGGLAPQALPQDDTATGEPGSTVAVDVLGNDLGPLDPDTLAVTNAGDSGGAVVASGGRPEIQVPVPADDTDPISLIYRVCASEDGGGSGGSGDGGDDDDAGLHGCGSATLTVVPMPATPALTVAIAGPATIGPSDESILPVTVTNTGDDPVSDLSVRVAPPNGYAIGDLEEDFSEPAWFSCQGQGDLATSSLPLVCTAASLPPHTTAKLNVSLDAPAVAGHGDLVAVAAAPAPNGATVTAKASHAVTTGDPADIEVTQSGAVLTNGANAGDLAVDVTLGVASGAAPAGSDAAMSFTIPDGAGFQAITAGNDDTAQYTECTAPAVGKSGEIDCSADIVTDGPGIDAADEFSWHLVLTPPPDADSVTLTATGTSDAPDPDESNNTATETYPLAGAPGGVDLAAGFTGGTSAADGGDVTIHPTVTVPDGATATSVTETITLPDSVTFQSLTSAEPTDLSCHTPDVGSSGTITCTADSLSATVAWNLVIAAPAIPQVATVTNDVTSETADPDATNDDATLDLTLTGPKATPTVALTGPTVPVAIGTDVPLAVTVTSPIAGFAPGGAVTLMVDGTATGDAVALNSDGTATVHWAAKDLGPHQLSAHYNGDGSFAAAESVTLDVTVAPPGPDATITIATAGAMMPGAGFFRIVITNVGTEPGVVGELRLTLPTGITLDGSPNSGDGPGFTCSGEAPVRCVPSAPITLGPGASSEPIIVPVTVAATATGGAASATVVMAGDVNSANDTATVETVVTTSGLSVSLSGPVTDPLAGQTTQLTLTVGNESAADLAGPTTVDVTLPDGTPAGQHLAYARVATPGWTCRSANLKGVTVVTCRTDRGIPAGTKLDPLPIAVTIPATAALGTDLIRYDARSGDGGGNDQATGTPLALAIGPSKPSHVTATLVGAEELSATGGDYVLDVANQGAGATTGPLAVSVPLPPGVIAQTGIGGPWQCATDATDPDEPTLACTLAQPVFAGSAAPELPVRLTADPAAAGDSTGGMVSLVATVHTTDATGPATGIGAAALHLPPPALPVLQLDSTALPAGSYGLAVHNSGAAPSTGPVTISEQLPAGFIATVNTGGTPWTCGQSDSILNCTAASLTIPPGGSAGPPDVTVSGPAGVAGAFAMSGQVLAGGTHSAVTGVVAHVTLPPATDANPATTVTLGDSPLYDGEHSTATMHLRANGSLPVGGDVLFALVLPPGITVDPASPITVDDDVPEPAAGSIDVSLGGTGSTGGVGGGTTSQITCRAVTGGTAVACESTFLQADSIGSVTIPILVSAGASGTASFYSGIVPYLGLANLNYAVSAVQAGGVSALGSHSLTQAEIRQFTADAGAPQTQVDSTPSETGGQTPTVVDLDASGTTDVGRTLTYGWVQTMGPPVAWKQTSGVLQPGQDNQAAFPDGTVFTGIDAGHPTAGPLAAPAALGVKPSFTAPTVSTDTVLGFRVYVTDGNTVQTADTTVTITAVADQPPSGTMTARDTTTGTTLTDGGPTPAAGDQIEVTVTTADADGDSVQTAVSILRPANLGTAIAPEPGETSGDERHFTFAWPAGTPQLTLQAQMTDGHLAPDGTAVASYATLSVGPAPDPIAVTVTGAPAQPVTPGQKVTLTASVTGVPGGAPAPDITWSQVSGPTATPAPATGASTTVTIPAGVKAGDSIVLQAAAVVGSGADAQAASAQVTIAAAPPPPLAVAVTNLGNLTVGTGATLALTATGSGGTAPITYKWAKVTGDGTLSNDTAATASYKAGTGAGFDMLQVTATDANHQTATQDVPVQIGTTPAASTTPGTAACDSSGAIGSLFGQQSTTGATGHYLLKLGAFTIDLGHLDLGGKTCTPDFSISVGGNPGDNITATLGPLTFSHIAATLSTTKLTITSAAVSTPSEWHLGTVTASNIVVTYDPFAITGSITWVDQLPLLSKPGTASSVSTTMILGKDSLTLNASANVAGGSVTAVGAISTSSGDFTLHVTATALKVFGQAFSGSGTLSDAGGHVLGAVTVSWAAGKTADLHGLHLTSASLTWDKDGITAQAGATIDGKFTASLKANYDDTNNWSATVTGGLAADWDVTSGLTLTKASTSLTGTISDKNDVLTFNVAVSISGSWTAGPVTLTNLSASFADSSAPKKSCGVVPKDDVYLTIGGKATIAVGSKSIALTAEACIVPATGAWTIASTATLTGVTLVSDLSLTGISLTVAHQGSQYSAVLVGTATSHGVTGSVQVALIDGSTGLNFLAAATIDLSKLGVSIPGCGALIYSTEAISDLSTVPGLDLGLTSAPTGGSAQTTAGGTGGCGSSAGSGSGGSGTGTGTGGSGGAGGSGAHALRSAGHALSSPGAPRDVVSGACRSARIDDGDCFGYGPNGKICTYAPADFAGLASLPTCPESGSTPATHLDAADDGCAITTVDDSPCFDVNPDGTFCTIDDYPGADAASLRGYLPACITGYLPLGSTSGSTGTGGPCTTTTIDDSDCFGYESDAGSPPTLCTFVPGDFVGVAWLPTCGLSGSTPVTHMDTAADACLNAGVTNPACFDVNPDGTFCTIDDYGSGGDITMRGYLPVCVTGYLPLASAGTAGGTGGVGCAMSMVDDPDCFGFESQDGGGQKLCTYAPSNFVGVAWLPTCGLSRSTQVQRFSDIPADVCAAADVNDPSCFDVNPDATYCTIDAYSPPEGGNGMRAYLPTCSAGAKPLSSAAGTSAGGVLGCSSAPVDDPDCFGYTSADEPAGSFCTFDAAAFVGVATLQPCPATGSTPVTQYGSFTDPCYLANVTDASCFEVNLDGTLCSLDGYSGPDVPAMTRFLPSCAPGATPLPGGSDTGANCYAATVNTPDCFGFLDDDGYGLHQPLCTYHPVDFTGIGWLPSCPKVGATPVVANQTSSDPCGVASLGDASCFQENTDGNVCTSDTMDRSAGGLFADALPPCTAGSSALITASQTGSGAGSGPGNTGATGAANNPTKGIGIPAGFTAMGSFTLPISMEDFLAGKLGLPQPIVDSDLIVQVNLSGTPVIKATLTAGDDGIVLMHNDSNGTKLTLQSISLTISLGGSFGLAAQGGLDLPKPDAKGPTDVTHLTVTAAISIQVAGIPSITISLSKTGDVWDDAFGVSGLDLGDIAIQGGITFSSPPTPSIGFGANIVSLPEAWRKPLGIQDNPDGTMEPITLVINISAANPILQISLGVPDGHTFLEPMQPIASILPLGDSTKQQLSQVLEVDDASLIIAPYGGSVGSFTFTPGFHLQFDATMLGVNVNVKADVGISPPAIDAHVDVGAFGFGGLNMDETQLDLSITPTTGFMAHFSGGLSIGGASTTATLDAKASLTGGMTFDFESDINHVGYGSMLSLDDLDIFGRGSYTSLKQVPSVTFGMTATAHVLGAGMTVYGDVQLAPVGIIGFDLLAAPHPVSLGGAVSVGGTGCNATALAGLPDVPTLPTDGPCFQFGYHPLQDPIPTVDINGAIHTSAGIDVAASLTLDDTGLAASGTVQLGPLANVDVSGNLYFGSGLAGVTACDETSVLNPAAPCNKVAVHPGDFVFSAALASQVSLAGMSANLFAGVGHLGNHDWVVGRATLGILDTPSSPIHGNAQLSGAFYHNSSGFHFDLSGAGSVTLGGSVTGSGHLIGGYSLAGATFEVSSDACTTLSIPGLTQLAGAGTTGCVGFTGSLGQAGGPLPSTQLSGVVADVGGVLRFQAAGAVNLAIAGFSLANASLVAGNMSGPVVVTISAHTGLGDIVSVDGAASVSTSGDFCLSGTASIVGSSGGASACTAGEPNPGVKVWFTTYGFSITGYIGPGSFALTTAVHLNPHVAGTFAGITLSAYADFDVNLALYYHYPITLPFGAGTVDETGLSIDAAGTVGVQACAGHLCIGPSLDVAIQYNPGFGICVGTSLLVTDIKICYATTSGLQVVEP